MLVGAQGEELVQLLRCDQLFKELAGKGETAAGSPKGTKVGGKYYMYRIKYRGGNWDANRRGIPALMREFTKTTNVLTNPTDQAVTLGHLTEAHLNLHEQRVITHLIDQICHGDVVWRKAVDFDQ